MTRWADDDDKFRRFLLQGKTWEKFVAGELRGRGFYARYDADVSFRVGIADSVRYKDQVDVTVLDKEYEYIRIEVKSVAQVFYGPDDFPFPLPIVTTVGSWDNCSEEAQPHVVVCVSQITGGMMALNTERTRDYWQVQRKHDAKRDIDEVFYVCDKRHWRSFDALVAWLDGQCNRFNVHPLQIPEPDPSQLKERR